MKVCYECEKREIGCHSKCEDYAKEKEQWETIREMKRKEFIIKDFNYRAHDQIEKRKHHP